MNTPHTPPGHASLPPSPPPPPTLPAVINGGRVRSRWRLFSRNAARRTLLGSAVLITLVVAFYVEENCRGALAWSAFKREAADAGISLEIADYIPAPVPDSRNFAATPLIARLYASPSMIREENALSKRLQPERRTQSNFPIAVGHGPEWGLPDWVDGIRADLAGIQERESVDLGAHLASVSSEMDEIARAAAERPVAVYPEIDDVFKTGIGHPPLVVLMTFSRLYAVRAMQHLDAGEPEAAAGLVCTMFRLVLLEIGGKSVLSQLCGGSLTRDASSVIWEGMARKLWRAEDLVRFDTFLSRLDFITAMRKQIAVENAVWSKVVLRTPELFSMPNFSWRQKEWRFRLSSWLLENGPRGWRQQTTVALGRDSIRCISNYDTEHGRISKVEREWMGPYSEGIMPWVVLFDTLASTRSDGVAAALNQSGVALVRTACRVEMYRLKTGKYPASLDEPDFTKPGGVAGGDELHDPVSGGPVCYRPPSGNSGYVL
ncbi:MAG: hypothetical protein LBK99_17240, partial [Opitutaceae bacterium]|nr:hypothetical protein [Opitutaceae bacterium]